MKLFTEKQLEIVKLASKDTTRPILEGLHFDGNTTVTTDGHRMLAVTSEEIDNQEWPVNGIAWNVQEVPFTLPRKAVEKALKNINKKQDLPILSRVAVGQVPDSKVSLQTTDLEITDNVATREIEGRFPDYKRIIPDYKTDEYKVMAINAKYLKELCSILEKYDTDNHKIEIHIKDENTPMVITADDREGTTALGIIMPVKRS